MDAYNMEDLAELQPQGTKAKVELLGKYDYGKPIIIEDPYFVSATNSYKSNNLG